MATHNLSLAPVKISVDVSVCAAFRPPILPLDDILQDLHPIRAAVIELNPYRVRMGWPVAVPPVDSRSRSSASATGLRLTDRPVPADVVTGATIRWCGDPDTWDDTAFVWRPIQGELSGYRWRSSADFAPTFVDEFKYQVGKELFGRGALNFDGTNREHLWSQFNGGISGTRGYTVIMAVWLNSTLGNTGDREVMGIWAPGHEVPDPDEDTWDESDDEGYSLLLERAGLVIDTENGQSHVGLTAEQLVAAARPVYIAATFSHPVTRVYGSLGPGTTRQFDYSVGDAEYPQTMNIVLGRTNGSLLATADMAIFDLGIYGDVLTPAQIEQEISLLSRSYGG